MPFSTVTVNHTLFSKLAYRYFDHINVKNDRLSTVDSICHTMNHVLSTVDSIFRGIDHVQSTTDSICNAIDYALSIVDSIYSLNVNE